MLFCLKLLKTAFSKRNCSISFNKIKPVEQCIARQKIRPTSLKSTVKAAITQVSKISNDCFFLSNVVFESVFSGLCSSKNYTYLNCKMGFIKHRWIVSGQTLQKVTCRFNLYLAVDHGGS